MEFFFFHISLQIIEFWDLFDGLLFDWIPKFSSWFLLHAWKDVLQLFGHRHFLLNDIWFVKRFWDNMRKWGSLRGHCFFAELAKPCEAVVVLEELPLADEEPTALSVEPFVTNIASYYLIVVSDGAVADAFNHRFIFLGVWVLIRGILNFIRLLLIKLCLWIWGVSNELSLFHWVVRIFKGLLRTTLMLLEHVHVKFVFLSRI